MSLSLAWDAPCLPSSNLLSFLSVLEMGGPLAVFCERHECWGYWHLLPLVGLIRTRLKVFLPPFTHNECAPNFSCVCVEGSREPVNTGAEVRRALSHLGHRVLGQELALFPSWIQ